ncbi:transposase [Lactobacillus sp. CC-MHH1034]|uniref:transposase n=1 Tax=Agrilactobacillus fermenti TaxID=2586909 RepID=UPI001E556835|nr:transposase [Agrilactobacillus fermenti]MCD2255482.1 transposase [Agrilactobacillus fermenti]
MYQNYNNNQLRLSIPLEINIPSNHVAVAISHFVDSIPDKLIYEKAMTSGRPAYNPAMLLKVILFAYTRQNFSGRKIEAMAQENIPTKWLNGKSTIFRNSCWCSSAGRLLSHSPDYFAND